jgi:hypothetical protein
MWANDVFIDFVMDGPYLPGILRKERDIIMDLVKIMSILALKVVRKYIRED